MPPKTARPPRKPPAALYIGEWMARLGIRPVELAKGTGLTESYISELVSRKKDNPSFNAIADIADYLGVTISDLRRPPPSAAVLGGLSAEAIARLKPR